ncbi:MAG TPA: hypothetical protein VM010_00220 [Chitinophagaceae bacterium]|nr:hypothetical protein [Chitinophagaceae bacterium]
MRNNVAVDFTGMDLQPKNPGLVNSLHEASVKQMNDLVLPDKNTASVKLAVIESLFDALHAAGIRYCHWKSSEHLQASMTGDTDLDVLFDAGQKMELEQLLASLGFKKFNSIALKQYRAIEDFIGFDNATGKIVHLHTHYQLTIGEVYVKSYQLPFANALLESCIYDEAFGLYRIAPAYELVLLYFRTALKIRTRDVLRMYMHKHTTFGAAVLVEYNWLRLRTSDSEIEAVLKKTVQHYMPVYALVTGAFRRDELYKLSRLLKNEFKAYRFLSPANALFVRWYREGALLALEKLARRLKRPIARQRINPRGGIIVALIGADGSGKSTVIRNLQATFQKKLDVYTVYLGNGRIGTKSWTRKVLLYSKKMAAKPKPVVQTESVKMKKVTLRGFKANLFTCLQALVIAQERYKNLRRIQAAKKRGMLVLCDRFPQNQTPGYNDGPLLHAFLTSPHFLYRLMAKREARIYAKAQSNPPDLVLKLVADPDVIKERKPSLASMQVLEKKVNGIKELTFTESCRVVTINAMQPLDVVLRMVKKEIWANMP